MINNTQALRATPEGNAVLAVCVLQAKENQEGICQVFTLLLGPGKGGRRKGVTCTLRSTMPGAKA